jgi:glycosyltransferase involved in cell wall biosynthesis
LVRSLIYAPAARMGGARAHVLGVVPELASIAPKDEVLLIAQPDLLDELPALPPSWTLRAERAPQPGLTYQLRQLAWEQRVLPRIARRWRADLLLSFGSFVPLRAPCPTVLEAGNALPFTRAYWQVLRREPLLVQVEAYARWALLLASLRAARRVLTPTRAMRVDVVTRVPDLLKKVDVALWGVAPIFRTLRWSQPAGEMTILGVSKHGINKEFDVLVAALPALRRRWPDLGLVLTGTPDESRWSRRSVALAERLRVTDAVRFAGDVPNAQVPKLIQQSRLLVFPTWCESFGLPLAEALTMGAPAVAADIPACREVGDDAARYYASGDPDSLAATIGDLLGAPEAAAAMAQAAFARGKKFDWRANAHAVRASLHQALR